MENTSKYRAVYVHVSLFLFLYFSTSPSPLENGTDVEDFQKETFECFLLYKVPRDIRQWEDRHHFCLLAHTDILKRFFFYVHFSRSILIFWGLFVLFLGFTKARTYALRRWKWICSIATPKIFFIFFKLFYLFMHIHFLTHPISHLR